MENKLSLEIKQFNGEIESLEITNNAQLENANKLASKCNALIKQVKAEHKEEIANYHNLHKEAKAKEKEALEPLEKAKEVLKKAIGTYMSEQDKKRLEAEKKQQEEIDFYGVALTEIEDKPKLNGTHVRKTWKARVVDESKVPVKFGNHVIRPIDISKLNDIAKFEEGKAVIDGVEFYQEETVVIK